MFDLTGKRAVVTGSGQGIGLGIARHLAAQGAHVIVNDFVADRAESAATALAQEGLSAEALPFDVTDLAAVRSALGDQVIDIIVALEVADKEAGDRVIAMAPRINDAILQDLYGVLHTRRIMRGGIVDVTAIKLRIVTVAQGVMGEGVVIDALVQGVAQHPL